MKWLKHAFAIDSPTALEIDEPQRALVEAIAAEVVRRRLTTPATLMLEMHRPFHNVSAQVMHFFQPILSILTDTAGYEGFAALLEQRGSVDYIIQRIAAAESPSAVRDTRPETPDAD